MGAVVAVAIPASAAGHEKDFGVTAGYVSRNSSALAGIMFQYRFTKVFRLAADAQMAFRNKDRDALLIDVNAHFPFSCGSRTEVYPIAGANMSAWSRHEVEVADDEADNSTHTSRSTAFGLNAGLGGSLRVTSSLKLSLEATFTAVKRNSGARVAAIISYSF